MWLLGGDVCIVFLFLVGGDAGNKNARCLVQLGSQLGVDQIR
jgi:hypothetical protein